MYIMSLQYRRRYLSLLPKPTLKGGHQWHFKIWSIRGWKGVQMYRTIQLIVNCNKQSAYKLIDFFYCIGFNVPFNTFRVISAVSLKYRTAGIVAWYPARVALFWQWVNQFFRWTTLYMSSIDKGASSTNLNSLVWLGLESNPGPPRHEANALPQCYCTGLLSKEYDPRFI